MSKKISRLPYLASLAAALLLTLIGLKSSDNLNSYDSSLPWVPSSTAATRIGVKLIDSRAYVMSSGESITLTVAFTNCTPKTIKNISGQLRFMDLLGKALFGVKMERNLEQNLEPGQTVNIDVGYRTVFSRAILGNEFYLPEGATPGPGPQWGVLQVVQWANTAEIRAEFLPRTLSYTNGTREEYEP